MLAHLFDAEPKSWVLSVPGKTSPFIVTSEVGSNSILLPDTMKLLLYAKEKVTSLPIVR